VDTADRAGTETGDDLVIPAGQSDNIRIFTSFIGRFAENRTVQNNNRVGPDEKSAIFVAATASAFRA
jgi:hypothetical protein